MNLVDGTAEVSAEHELQRSSAESRICSLKRRTTRVNVWGTIFDFFFFSFLFLLG
ncbi:uncharacterized protein J3R85_010880 [Psidium guajava]|nr:uncharacterized protein J3R85_010880 [Psidium guajava]